MRNGGIAQPAALITWISVIYSRLLGRIAFGRPLLSDPAATCAARSKQLISHITYSSVRRRKSTLIEIQYIPDYHLLLSLGELL